jgi:hypothetical protein
MWLVLTRYQGIIIDLKKTELSLLGGGATNSLKVADGVVGGYG